MIDLISRQAAIEKINELWRSPDDVNYSFLLAHYNHAVADALAILKNLPSAQTLYGYNIEHLELIARVLQKEDLPPERTAEVLTDIGRIVAIVQNEFEEVLRKAVEQCTI